MCSLTTKTSVFFYTLALILTVPTTRAKSPMIQKFQPDLNPETKVPLETCRSSSGTAYVNNFPSSENCSMYWICQEIAAGVPAASPGVCPPYLTESGKLELQYWNFLLCTCDFPWKIPCYNPANDSHLYHRFDCAVKLEINPMTDLLLLDKDK